MTSLSSPVYPRRTKTLVALGIAVIGFGIFIAMWHSAITSTDFARFDQPVLTLLSSHRTPFETSIMEVITRLLAPFSFALFVTVGCVVWYLRRRIVWRPLLLMGAMALATLTSVVVKHLVGRSRPPHAFMVAPFELDFSFPSGHTIAIATFVFVLSYLLYSRHVALVRVVAWLIAGGSLIAIVALSRLYLGYHWITDVSASVGLAFIILSIIIIVDTYTPARLKTWKPASRRHASHRLHHTTEQ